MNIQEIKDLLNKINSVYPYAFKNKTAEEKQDIVNIWHNALKSENAENVNETLNEYIKSNNYMPTIADLLKKNKTGHYGRNYTEEFLESLYDVGRKER